LNYLFFHLYLLPTLCPSLSHCCPCWIAPYSESCSLEWQWGYW